MFYYWKKKLTLISRWRRAALLKAIAEKLIPGIPEDTRIAILQQTKLTDDTDGKSDMNGQAGPTVLQEVVDKATAKNAVELEIRGLCH